MFLFPWCSQTNGQFTYTALWSDRVVLLAFNSVERLFVKIRILALKSPTCESRCVQPTRRPQPIQTQTHTHTPPYTISYIQDSVHMWCGGMSFFLTAYVTDDLRAVAMRNGGSSSRGALAGVSPSSLFLWTVSSPQSVEGWKYPLLTRVMNALYHSF